MLIVISIIFLMFSIPIDIYFLGYAYGAFQDVTPEQGAKRWLFYSLVTLLYYGNKVGTPQTRGKVQLPAKTCTPLPRPSVTMQ